MLRLSTFFVLTLSVSLSAQSIDPETLIQKGNETSVKLLQKLGSELKMLMQNNGVINALHFCSQNALTLTDDIARSSGTSIKRISMLNRNPINGLSTDEKKLFERWQTSIAKGEKLPDYELNQHIYYKPILINNEVCLKCHGNITQDSAIAKEIKTLYPDDKAIGYKVGDLRGAIRIEF